MVVLSLFQEMGILMKDKLNYFISMIPYANMAPYRFLPKPPGATFINYTPKQSVAAIKAARVVAAPVPIGALPLLDDSVEFIGKYGISAEGSVGSVLLFSKIPFNKLNSLHRIFVTNQSASSISLLLILINNLGKKKPVFTFNEENADAYLYIGDEALIRAQNNNEPYVIDLVTEWYKNYKLPFVFARWVVRKDSSEYIKKELAMWLSGITKHEDELIDLSAKFEADRINMRPDKMRNYLNGMKRVLGEKEIKGQDFFIKKISEFTGRDRLDNLLNVKKRNRIGRKEALDMFKNWPLNKLMNLAWEKRMELYPDNIVTYVRDTNPNYTNICETKCSFCAFKRNKNDADAYTLSPIELAEKIKMAEKRGATTVLLQGGNNPEINLNSMLEYIREIKKMSPSIHIHPFSPPEIFYICKKDKISTKEILESLYAEGINTMPGGGGEILVDSVRNKLSPTKCSADDWLRIMEEAHSIGFKTTATLMYGHIESDEDIIEHLFKLRSVQDKTNGFTSFIPWSFKPGNSELSEHVKLSTHSAYYIRIIALARLVLDNFDHIQSSWFSESDNAGELGLLAGADDFGGILIEENVLATSGYKKTTSESNVQNFIKRCGFIPAIRDSHYKLLKLCDK